MRALISMRVENAAAYHEPRDAIAHDWFAWAARHDIELYPVPNSDSAAERYIDLIDPALLILSGGNDVVAVPGRDSTSAVRDRTERTLIARVIARNRPVLAVCRGLHVVNLHFGGRVCTSLADLSAVPARHVANVHRVSIVPSCRNLASACDIEVNSFHGQGVGAQDVAPELDVFARADDGVIEGLVHRLLPIVAVQWHPERPGPQHQFDDVLFHHLLRLALQAGTEAARGELRSGATSR